MSRRVAGPRLPRRNAGTGLAPGSAHTMTTDPALPEDLRRFLLFSVPSVPFLEALLLFHAEPDASFHADAVARRLYLGAAAAASLMQALADARLIAPLPTGQGWRYAPSDAERAALIDRLARAYAADVVGISQLIHAGAPRSAHRFADAFKLRKKDD